MHGFKIQPHNEKTRGASILRFLTIILFLVATGCDVVALSEDDDNLRRTRVALSVQQTLVAEQVQESSGRTLSAQQTTIAANAAAQTAQARTALTPNLEVPQMTLSAQKTIDAAEAASAVQGTSAAATQTAAAAQFTAVGATQAALSAQQTMSASGPTLGAPPATTAPAAGPGRPPPGSQLFDDFSDNVSWPVVNQPGYSTGYLDNHFFITLNAARTDAWAVAGWSFTDVWVSTSGFITYGGLGDRYGAICRYQDNNNFYFLAIGDDSDYVIGKYRDGVVSLIGMSSPEYSAAIHNGGNNQVEAWCVGNELTLTVNGVTLASVYDNDFLSGDIGLIAMAADSGNMSASFDYILAEQ